MFKNIKKTIEYVGLNPKTEVIKFLIITISGSLVSFITYIFLKEIMYLTMSIAFTLFFDYLLFYSYSLKKTKIDESRENEFINLISNFEIFILNKNNVYQSFNKAIPYCSEWMKNNVSRLLKDIDSDKSVTPYVNFAKLFTNNIATNIMLSIYTMVDQGESYEQINNFQILFEQFQKSSVLEKAEKKKRSLSILPSLPLIGAGGITIALTMCIISIIGDFINVI